MASAQLPSNNKNGVLRSIGTDLLFHGVIVPYVPVFSLSDEETAGTWSTAVLVIFLDAAVPDLLAFLQARDQALEALGELIWSAPGAIHKRDAKPLIGWREP